MKPPYQTHTKRRGDRAEGIYSEEHGCEVRGMGLEGVFAIEERETFMVGAPRGEQDVGTDTEGGRFGRSELVGGAGYDMRFVGQEQAEDVVPDFTWEGVEREGHLAVKVGSLIGRTVLLFRAS